MQMAVTTGKRERRLSADGVSFLGERDSQVIHQEREGEGGRRFGDRGESEGRKQLAGSE